MSRPARPRPQHTSGTAIASLFCGILALAISWVPIVGLLAFPLGVIALATAFAAIRAVRRYAVAGRALAYTGLVTGSLSLLVALTLLYSFLTGFTGPAFRDDVNQLIDAFESESP